MAGTLKKGLNELGSIGQAGPSAVVDWVLAARDSRGTTGQAMDRQGWGVGLQEGGQGKECAAEEEEQGGHRQDDV